ncbi:MAG: hypothetical protein Q8R92_11705 [Deltaproteobacteria bacterium]|nr:hypothetical protein [Deltaproteobacteria bacterium]
MIQRSIRTALVFTLLLAPSQTAATTTPKPLPRTATVDLAVALPSGEQTLPVYRFSRQPHEYTQAMMYFSAPSGVTEEDHEMARQVAENGCWAVLLDLGKLTSKFKDEAEFDQAVVAIALAMRKSMSDAIGPRMKDQGERKWPYTFAGRGAGAVRASRAAIGFEAKGKVRGVMMIEPAVEAPGIGTGAAQVEHSQLLPKLGVAPVAFAVSGENETVHTLEKDVIGYNAVKPSVKGGLEFISMHYPIRRQRAPRTGPAVFDPGKLFQPGR